MKVKNVFADNIRMILSRTMLAVMVIAAAVNFAACGDDDDDNNSGGGSINPPINNGTTSLTVSVENGADLTNISTVIAAEEDVIFSDTADFNGGNFTLHLKTPTVFEPIMDEAVEGINISDMQTQIAVFYYLTCLNASGNITAILQYGLGDTQVFFMYADRDCDMIGSFSESSEGVTYNFNSDISLKKGWNKIYTTSILGTGMEVNTTITTTEVSGMKWIAAGSYFYPQSAKVKKPAIFGHR
ncbi:MAG: hypothetical protein LBR28_03385 [Bacteroidales bacterium]|jgi:hypothetical protein|nr:hypothetical protein [Bacteroidales bacterium]